MRGQRLRHPAHTGLPRRPAVAAVAAVVALTLASCDSGPDDRFAAEPVRRAEVVERVSAPGTVGAVAQAELVATAPARVEELPVADGARVKRGDLVARLSSEQVDDAVRQAEAAVAAASQSAAVVPELPTGQALAALNQLQSQVTATSSAVIAALRSALPLLPRKERARVRRQIDQAQAQLAESERRAAEVASAAAAQAEQQTASLRRSVEAATAAQRAQAQLALDAAREQRERLTLRAPIAGVVQLGRAGGGGAASLPSVPSLPEGAEDALGELGGTAAPADGPVLRVGSQVGAGQMVATVYDTSELRVAAQVDETDVALVSEGQPAEVELDAFLGVRFTAKVRRVAVAPEAQALAGGVTYQVDLALGKPVEPPEGTAPVPRIGMTATVGIEVRRVRDALSVPGSALVGRPGGQGVLVVSDGHVQLREVRVAADGDDRVALASGVREGELVVTRGAERLRDGQEWPGPS